MIIREAKDSDVPEIVELLAKSLGYGLIPRTEKFWNWKHTANPFGKSLVLVAQEGDMLVGVRAFMQWRWKSQDRLFHTLRAVDTATEPNHQGKGIFKKLTLALVEEAKSKAFDFIFNTPNNKSKPGYLKMGWMSTGRYPLKVIPLRPLDLLFPSLPKELDSEFTQDPEGYPMELLDSCSKYGSSAKVTTDVSGEYYRWRYLQIPDLKYQTEYSRQDGWVAIFRVKVSGRFKELRLCDLVQTSAESTGSVFHSLYRLAKVHNLNVISLSGRGHEGVVRWPSFKIGPEIAFRPLVQTTPPPNWTPSIGDIELF